MFFEDSKGDTVGEGSNTSVLCAEKIDQSCDVLKHPSNDSEIALCNTPLLEAYKALDVLVAMGSETDPKSQGTLKSSNKSWTWSGGCPATKAFRTRDAWL